MQNANIIIGDKQRHPFRISGYRSDNGPSINRGDRSGSGASTHVPGVKAHAKHGAKQD